MSVDFTELVQQSEQLKSMIGASTTAQKSISQLGAFGERMFNEKVDRLAQDKIIAQAAILLGKKGFDAPSVERSLLSIPPPRPVDLPQTTADISLQAFLRNEEQNAMLNIVERRQQNTFETVDGLYWDTVLDSWEGEKQEILQSLLSSSFTFDTDHSSFLDRSTFLGDQSSVNYSLLSQTGAGGGGQTRTRLDYLQQAYARQIIHYVTLVLNGQAKCNQLVVMFKQTAQQIKQRRMECMYQMLEFLTDLPLVLDDTSKLSVTTSKAKGISDLSSISNNQPSRSLTKARDQVVNQARKYLEFQYRELMEEGVRENLYSARRGGVPGNLSLIKSFFNVNRLEETPGLERLLVEKDFPIWPLLYLSIRIGDMQTFKDIIEQARQFLEEFAEIALEFGDATDQLSPLSAPSQSKIRVIYRRSVHHSTDPFKRLVYCIVGGVESNTPHSEIIRTTEDWLWFKLHFFMSHQEHDLAHSTTAAAAAAMSTPIAASSPATVGASKASLRVDSTPIVGGGGDAGGTGVTLSAFRKHIYEELGEDHFAGNDSWLYFDLLMMIGLFEPAIDYLFRVPELRTHAVHVAAVLQEMNLLSINTDTRSPILSRNASSGMYQLNFARMVVAYTKQMNSTHDLEWIIHYLYLLRNIDGSSPDSISGSGSRTSFFDQAIGDIILETRQFDRILGAVSVSSTSGETAGLRENGLIDLFLADPRHIISSVAKTSESRGLYEDAIHLFYLAQDYERTAQLLNSQLLQVISLRPHQQEPHSKRSLLQKKAQSYALRFRSSGKATFLRSETTSTLYMLLDLMRFYDLHHLAELTACLDISRRTKILPFTKEDIESCLKRFTQYTDDIRAAIPEFILTTMKAVHDSFYRESSMSGGVGAVNASALSSSAYLDMSSYSTSAYLNSTLKNSTTPSSSGHEGSLQRLMELKIAAESLMTFAGQLPYGLSTDIISQLIQLANFVN